MVSDFVKLRTLIWEYLMDAVHSFIKCEEIEWPNNPEERQDVVKFITQKLEKEAPDDA